MMDFFQKQLAAKYRSLFSQKKICQRFWQGPKYADEQVNILLKYTTFYKPHFYKQRQTDIGKKSSKC